MPYSSFSLQAAVDQFNLDYLEEAPVFPETIPPLPINSEEAITFLTQQLERDISLARRAPTEKAKSEFVTAPVLATLREIQRVGLHSGVPFDVSAREHLNGVCSFLITLSSTIEIIRAPVVAVVEAKRSVVYEGVGQCVAEMVAAQRFNQKANLPSAPVFGCITNGFYWRFLQLLDSTVLADSAFEYPLMPVDELMQRLCYTVSPTDELTKSLKELSG